MKEKVYIPIEIDSIKNNDEIIKKMENTMHDEDTLEQICEHAQVIRYDLKSVSFSLEGVKIPSFIGKITIKLHGTDTMANFVNMLFEFGEYSGVGIKTSLGMGYMKIINEGGRK